MISLDLSRARQPTLGAAILALMLTSCQCTNDPKPPNRSNAGGSAGTGGGSAASDAGGDAGTGNAGATGTNGEFLPCHDLPPASDPIPADFPAGATRLPALPAEVEVFQVPPPPEPLSWKDCGTGCKELETPWAEPGMGALIVTSLGGLVNGQPWLVLVQRLPDGLRRRWVGPADGAAAQAFMERTVTGSVNTGFSSPEALSSRGLSFVVYYREQHMHVYAGAPVDEPVCVAWRTPSWVPYSGAFSAGRWALAGPPLPVLSGAWPVVPGEEDIRLLGGYSGEHFNDVGAAGERLFWRGYGSDQKYRMWAWSPGENVGPLTQPAPDGSEDHCCAAADEQHIAWLRGTERYEDSQGAHRWGRVELLVHPLPIDHVPLQGTVVRQVPQDVIGNPGVVSSGYWAHAGHDADGEKYRYVVRLSDGQLWKIPYRSPDVLWHKVMFLSSEEIAILEKVWGSHAPWAHTVVRYRLDSLGSGEPAPPPAPASPP